MMMTEATVTSSDVDMSVAVVDGKDIEMRVGTPGDPGWVRLLMSPEAAQALARRLLDAAFPIMRKDRKRGGG